MSTPTATPRTDDEETPLITNHRVSAETYKRMVDLARELETELACEKENRNHLIEKGAKLETELARLRADLERFTGHGLLDCHAICDQRDAAVAERDQLRAERDQLRAEVSEARRAWLGDDYGHLPLIEALEKFRSDSDAESDRADVLYQRSCEVEHALRAEVERLKGLASWANTCIHHNDAERARYGHVCLVCTSTRAEKAEAALAEWSVLNLWGGTPEIIHEFIKGQQNRIHHCQDLEAECLEQARLLGMSGEREADLLGKLERLAKDKARLDWLEDHGWITGEPCDRAAIDAAMKP